MCKIRFLILALVLSAGAQQTPEVTFGTTVVSSAGLQGGLYLLKINDPELPNFKRHKPIATLYTTRLHVTPRDFRHGFPGITDRIEWFALDYTGRIWMERPGTYRFRLLSDDGSKLYFGNKLLIDNDGLHPPGAVEGSADFSRGVHEIRVSYFQGPGSVLALVLEVAGPGAEDWRVFDTNDFRPPADPAEWVQGTIGNIRKGANW